MLRTAHGADPRAEAAGCFDRRMSRRSRDRAGRLPRSDRLRGGRDHLPAAGLLGAHRAGRAQRPAGRTARAPSGSTASGTSLVLKIVKRLLDTGVSLQNIRVAVEHLRRRGVQRPGRRSR